MDIKDPQKLRTKILFYKRELDELSQITQKLEEECAAGKKILWAIAHSQAGSISIPDSSMSKADDSAILIASYNPGKRATIIQAKRKGQDEEEK